MPLVEHPVKGINHHLLDTALQGEPLHIHISEVDAKERSHAPHQHGGIEAFYMLEGEGTLEIEDETYTLKANESAVFDPQKLHGIRNDTDRPMRYMVIIYRGTTED
jgi:quercetin dioxygenase-like cupin family protein